MTKCKECFKPIQDGRVFCNSSCSATYNNKQRVKKTCNCGNCNTIIPSNKKYCNNKCQQEYQYKFYIDKWKQGDENGSKGTKRTLTVSSHIRKYIVDKYNNKCAKCGFDTKHPLDGKSILEIDHIDGDAKNNKEDNLILLCPNCHALTDTFRARNKNSTRK